MTHLFILMMAICCLSMILALYQTRRTNRMFYLISRGWSPTIHPRVTYDEGYVSEFIEVKFKAKDEQISRPLNEAYERQKLIEKYDRLNVPDPEKKETKQVKAGSWK